MKNTSIHVKRTHHKMIVASGIIVCGVITICWPEKSEASTVIGVTINLFWLLVEPV